MSRLFGASRAVLGVYVGVPRWQESRDYQRLDSRRQLTISVDILPSSTSLLRRGFSHADDDTLFRAIRLLRSFGVGLEFGRRGDLALFASSCPGKIRGSCGLP